MSDDSKTQYSYDPFKKEGRDRWGRKGEEKRVPPEIPNYDIIDFLGEGGMASVWSAKYRPLNQPRAVKVLSQAVAIDANFLERFGEEAKALARLEHPNIVQVYDASTDFACPYLAMDFVAGKTMNEVLKVRSLPQDEAIKYFGDIAEALDYAHGMGFVHRDIKPSNVMITNSGKAMLIDFGVASWLGGVSENANTITGTTRYMSPEACRGERVTKASDLWAFAVLMYRTLTGGMPFEGKSEREIMNAIINNPPNEPKHSNAKVRACLKRFLAKEPDKRPKSAMAMVNELRQAVKPFVFKAHKEGIAIGASFIMASVVVLAIVGGVVGYFVFAKPAPKDTSHKVTGLKAILAAAVKGKSDSTTSTTADPSAGAGLKDLGGVWYASFGDQWAEIHIDPTSDKRFHALISKRDQFGAETVEADGEFLSDTKFTYKETKVDDNPNGKSTPLGSFSGEISTDHQRVTGKLSRGDSGSASGQWVHSSEIEMSPYQNSQIGFSVPVPMGWQANTGEATSISPIGQQDVVFSVSALPLNGAQTAQDVLTPLVTDYSGATSKGGSYVGVGSNAAVTFGGQQGSSCEFLHQLPGGPKRHALLFATIRGESGVVVETWWPTAEDDIWSPVLDAMRKRFQFAQ